MQMSSNVKALDAVVAKQGREEGEHRDPNTYQDEGTTMTSIVPEATVNGQTSTFDTTMKTVVNHGGGTVTTRVCFSEWLGQHDIHLYIGDRVLDGFYLAPHEARDLIANLQAQLVYMGEEHGTEAVAA